MIIAICDDEQNVIDKIASLCIEHCNQNSMEVYIKEYLNPQELISSMPEVDVLFLDIEMDNLSGIDVKNMLEQKGSNTFIIFVTSHSEKVYDAFGKNVLGFIRKPVEKTPIETYLKKVSIILGTNKIIKVDEKNLLNTRDILYIAAEQAYTYIYLESKKILVRKSISQWEAELQDADFIRVHKSYLVNMRKVRDWTSDQLILEDATIKIPISRRCKETFKARYIEFSERMARYI